MYETKLRTFTIYMFIYSNIYFPDIIKLIYVFMKLVKICDDYIMGNLIKNNRRYSSMGIPVYTNEIIDCYYSIMDKYDRLNSEDCKGKLYHYTSINALESILRNNCLWITNSNFLNDKTELIYSIDLFKELFDSKKYDFINAKDMERYVIIINDILSNCYIFSSSTNNDSLALWGNYSKYDGYNIEFDLDTFFKRQIESKIFLVCNDKDAKLIPIGGKSSDDIEDSSYILSGEVIYNIDQQKEIISDVFSCINSLYQILKTYPHITEQDESTIHSRVLRAIAVLSDYMQLFKNPCFASEQEKRIIFQIGKNLDVIKYRTSYGSFIPYIIVKFEDLPITGVNVGPKNNIDIAFEGLKLFIKSEGYKIISNKNNKNYKNYKLVTIGKSKVPLRY